MGTGQERRKHWYALSSTNLWIGFTWYWISKFTNFLKKPDLLLAAVETLTHHVSMQIIMFVKQKRLLVTPLIHFENMLLFIFMLLLLRLLFSALV